MHLFMRLAPCLIKVAAPRCAWKWELFRATSSAVLTSPPDVFVVASTLALDSWALVVDQA